VGPLPGNTEGSSLGNTGKEESLISARKGGGQPSVRTLPKRVHRGANLRIKGKIIHSLGGGDTGPHANPIKPTKTSRDGGRGEKKLSPQRLMNAGCFQKRQFRGKEMKKSLKVPYGGGDGTFYEQNPFHIPPITN